MTQLSHTALEAATKAAYHATPRNKPYDKLTLFKKNLYRTESTAAITAYLAQMEKEGFVMVPKIILDAQATSTTPVLVEFIDVRSSAERG